MNFFELFSELVKILNLERWCLAVIMKTVWVFCCVIIVSTKLRFAPNVQALSVTDAFSKFNRLQLNFVGIYV